MVEREVLKIECDVIIYLMYKEAVMLFIAGILVGLCITWIVLLYLIIKEF